MNQKTLKTNGEFDYDLKNDILFFKAKDRDYKRSLELNNIVVDLDLHGFITGVQIFEASKFLELSKDALIKIPKWQLQTVVDNKIIEIRLTFNVISRNKIIEKNPIIIQNIEEELPNSELNCIAI